MDSPQSVVSPFKSSPEKQNADCLSRGVEFQRKEDGAYDSDGFIGVVEVFIHQARDIHNICIYHKQDVYAKLCLTSDPENTVSTQIVNGGGKNPVFNENLRLNVRTINSSLKCEVWMLSRVRNYLEDQLLGFALVPLSEVLIKNSKLEKEFSMSSTDLFHSPAGFVQLSLSYSGAEPQVMAIPALPASEALDAVVQGSEIPEDCELDKIEFPDPNIANENDIMVTEYFGIPCSDFDSQNSETLLSSDTENHPSPEIGIPVVESMPTKTKNSIQIPNHHSPPSSFSTNDSPSASLHASSQSCDTPGSTKSPNQEYISPVKENLKEKRVDVGASESDASGEMPGDSFAKPVVTVPEQMVVQQDIVDMYMKSMQQFTESLAKMKLPVDIKSGTSSSENSSSDQKLQASKSPGSRVFYGSRAFF